ncbi:hypothetical protein ABPG74_018981, partial [Tetrahymena malaccensis]
MSFSHLLSLILINLLSVSTQCLEGYIFNIVAQSCLPCSSNCKDCYNINQNQCTSCPLNYLVSQSNTSTCVQSCQIGEIQDSNQTCIKSQVQGCIKYDSNQNCLECNSNLEMDLNQKCHIKQNVCPSQYDFIQQPYSNDQCIKTCKTSYYQNQNNQICEKVIQCIQFDQSPSQFKYKVEQIDDFYDDQYLIRAGQCYFAVVNQNFEIVYERDLIKNNKQQYQLDGDYPLFQSFSIGKYGGCIANSTLIVIDFMKNLLVYEIYDLQNSYEVLQIDILNQIVFFKAQFNEIAWYDVIKNQFSAYQFNDQESFQGMFQINQESFGGSIYATDNSIIQINNTKFYQNQCSQQSGGAISIQNSVKAGNIIITKSEFINNQAYNSTGGAINLQNSNMILQDSILSANKALIGGAIYYEQIIPDFILESQKGKNNNNIISQNFAKFYGKNFGSTLRSIKIDIDDMKVLQNHATIQRQNGKIEISQFKSGDIINFKNIQMVDEENNPIIIPAYNQSQYIQYSYQVQEIIESLGVSFQWDQTNQQIQLVGELQSKQFYDRGFKLNAQIIFKPQSNMVLQIVSNNFPKLSDSKGNTYLQQGQLSLNITIYLDKCSLGQITKQQSNSTICEDCPEGKYSLNINDTVCSQCPESATQCYKSTILLKNGYWRENIHTDQIIYCSFNPSFCQAESKNSKDYCLEGHKGPLCYSCDTYGQLWGKQYSEIFSSGKCYGCEDNLSLIILENIMLFISIFCYIFAILKNIIRKLQAKLAGYFVNKANLLFLGSTLRQSDRPQIVSKILTDHLQILSLISTLSFKIPSYFNIPIQMSGNSLSITSKSIDCVLS